jgi:hypothetical protein
MKQASNNEIDLLLRSLAKGRDESAFGGGSASGGNGAFPDHLDADELNSYAEGVVPDAARARYTAHLADCNVCRRMVIDLSLAAGVANRFEVPTPQRGPGFWQKLATIFSPAVLRFAVPVLVLTAVIGIGLLTLRQEERTTLVARNQETGNAAPPPAAPSAQLKQGDVSAGNSNNAPPAGVPQESVLGTPGDSTVNDSTVNKTDRAEKAADTPSDLASGISTTTSPHLAKDGTPASKAGEDADSRGYAPEPKAAAGAPAPAAVQTEADELARAPKELPAKREESQRQRDDFKSQPDDVHGPNRGVQRSGPSNNAQQNIGGYNVGRNSGPNAEDKKAKAKSNDKSNDVEIRYVSGRRFAREDNAWIDTAYESSRATINIKRGSEQFRALVADEPGLGAIAEQLKGVVIVVWKTRAYRIQ